ncbi:hypothetical protein M422DRAFT_52269 [Sphaerobolus stellatus SS14]|uniref:DUF6533 domain-containing protein n=1 Tax=Sphaerobolus stellatus (strain SS14) TaxID=990650 RepID=A0A0C9TTP1_SPHS4|nr:hypothetical protein M422DRAFT_52269 [Sphaerobolus stellatus SS14]
MDLSPALDDSLLAGLMVTSYATVASLSFMVYEHGLIFSAEVWSFYMSLLYGANNGSKVEYIWKAKWSLMKVLYLSVRYIPVLTVAFFVWGWCSLQIAGYWHCVLIS